VDNPDIPDGHNPPDILESNRREEGRKNGKKDEAGVQTFNLQSQLSLHQL